MQDRIHLPGHIQLIAGGRFDSLRDHNYSAYRNQPNLRRLHQFTDKLLWLPQYAVTFNPVENLTLYSNYGVLLSLGPQAPWWTDNGSQFLAPFFTRQAEIGAKYRTGPAHSADDRVLSHARAVLLSQNDCRALTVFVPAEARAINALNPRAARRTTAWS